MGSERIPSVAEKTTRALTELSYLGAATYRLIQNLSQYVFLPSCLQSSETPFAVLGATRAPGMDLEQPKRTAFRRLRA